MQYDRDKVIFFHGARKFERHRLAHVSGSILVVQVKGSSLGICHWLLGNVV